MRFLVVAPGAAQSEDTSFRWGRGQVASPHDSAQPLRVADDQPRDDRSGGDVLRPVPANAPEHVEDLVQERGVGISHETVRVWRHGFGPVFADETRKLRIEGMQSSHWRWHVDELFVKISVERH